MSESRLSIAGIPAYHWVYILVAAGFVHQGIKTYAAIRDGKIELPSINSCGGATDGASSAGTFGDISTRMSILVAVLMTSIIGIVFYRILARPKRAKVRACTSAFATDNPASHRSSAITRCFLRCSTAKRKERRSD